MSGGILPHALLVMNILPAGKTSWTSKAGPSLYAVAFEARSSVCVGDNEHISSWSYQLDVEETAVAFEARIGRCDFGGVEMCIM